ncbi:hypothetical protein [Paenibacillus montaniterrae]|nr:hypothetical protein [Paenibacillus montaniterrae]
MISARSVLTTVLLASLLLASSIYEPSYARQQHAASLPDASVTHSQARLCSAMEASRNSKQTIEAFDFKRAAEEADIVVGVEILKLVEELEQPSPKTLWQAKVLTVWKGDAALDTIHILQAGNSCTDYVSSKLMKPQEQYVLFLKQAVSVKQPDSYWILGEETTIYQVAEDNYLVKHAYPDPELKEIEQSKLARYYKHELGLTTQVQVLEEQAFYNKLQAQLHQ